MDDLRQAPLNNGLPVAAFGNTLGAKFCGTEEIDLNEVLQTSLTKQLAERNVLSILRSDKLPQITSNKESIAQMFDAITFMIISHPPANSKLFLYVKCEEEGQDPEVLDMRFTDKGALYNLYFHTNITTDEDWKMIHHDQLSTCNTIAKENKGSFSFHPISNTGCLFSLTLPGKNS